MHHIWYIYIYKTFIVYTKYYNIISNKLLNLFLSSQANKYIITNPYISSKIDNLYNKISLIIGFV